MLGDLVAFIAIVALVVVVWRQQQRLRVLEFDIEGLRTAFLAHREKVTASGAQSTVAAPATPATEAASTEPVAAEITAAKVSQAIAALPPEEPQPAEDPGPWTPADTPLAEPTIARPASPTIETALGTRWAVWVGGLALALGGIFLVRYSIEAGILGPGARIAAGLLFSLALIVGG